MQDVNCEEQLKETKPKPIVKESMEGYRKLENAEQKPKIKDGETESEKADRHRFHYLAQTQAEQRCQSPML